MSENLFDRIKQTDPSRLESLGVIRRAKKTDYVCPDCDNGTGEDGDGLSVTQHPDRVFNYHCFKCDKDFTAVDLIGKHIETSDNGKIAEWAKENLGLQGDNFSPSTDNTKNSATSEKTTAENASKDYSEFYDECQKWLCEVYEYSTDQFRGLNIEVLKKVGAGLADVNGLQQIGENFSADIAPSKCCLILPYDKSRFFIRSLADDKIKRGNTGGEKNRLYKPCELDFDEPIFVVEGEIDCVSIFAAGFQAVALGGTAITGGMVNHFKEFPIGAKFIVAFDNDDAGKVNSPKAVDTIRSCGRLATSLLLSKDYKDANEFLQKDSEKFKERLKEMVTQAEKFFSSTVNSSGVIVLADVFDTLDTVTENLRTVDLKWGYKILDEQLPLLPGCYLLGALPSMGKTTFALNVAANICEQGTAVLYVSYEPTKEQIICKDLARYWYLKARKEMSYDDYQHTPTALQIMLGRYYYEKFTEKDAEKIRAELKEKRRNFYFFAGLKSTARDLIATIKPYVDEGVKFIVIDYLQLIKGADTRKSAREQIDETIQELRMFQTENNLVILFLSSFNRENYRNYVCMEAFKESGGLEFTADAILALQFQYSAGESRTDSETFQKKKQEKPRKIELVCLKNRYGIDFTDYFSYFSAHEFFHECKFETAQEGYTG